MFLLVKYITMRPRLDFKYFWIIPFCAFDLLTAVFLSAKIYEEKMHRKRRPLYKIHDKYKYSV